MSEREIIMPDPISAIFPLSEEAVKPVINLVAKDFSKDINQSQTLYMAGMAMQLKNGEISRYLVNFLKIIVPPNKDVPFSSFGFLNGAFLSYAILGREAFLKGGLIPKVGFETVDGYFQCEFGFSQDGIEEYVREEKELLPTLPGEVLERKKFQFQALVRDETGVIPSLLSFLRKHTAGDIELGSTAAGVSSIYTIFKMNSQALNLD